MSKIILGIDPDSKAHGVAVYYDSVLTELNCLTLFEIAEFLDEVIAFNERDYTVHMEDVCANSNSQFHWNKKDKPAVKAKKSENVGMCKQAQTELERMFSHYNVKVVKHKISKMWKSQESKKQFEKVTGWKKQSNEDTRSAAYFGFLGLK